MQRIAHRVAVSEEERNGLTAAFLQLAGSDVEKKMYYQKSEADIAADEAKAKFDAAVAAEVKNRQFASENEKNIQLAADKAATDTADAAVIP